MDITVYLAMNGFAFIFILFLMKWRPQAVAFFPFFGAFIAIYCFLGVAQDGSLTAVSNGNNLPIIAASAADEWTGVILVPLLVGAADLLGALLRVARKI